MIIINNFIIDLTECSSKADIHYALKNSLGFPEYYGSNLDALWDELSFRYSSENMLNISFIGESLIDDALRAYLSIIKEIIVKVNNE